MRKRVTAFVLAICMVAGFLSVTANAASETWVTVIFDAGDGQWPDGSWEREGSVLAGQTCEEIPADPERAGYTFAGWLTEEGEAFSGETEIFADTVVLAQWEENPMTTVTFEGCGGWWLVETVTENDELIWEDAFSLDWEMHTGGALEEEFPETPEREGWEFDSWNTESDGSGEVFEPGAEITEEITVFACWRRIFAIYYYGNAQDVPDMEEQLAAEAPGDAFCEFVLPDLERTGYTLLGWNTQADGSGGTYQPGETYLLEEDETPAQLYALWEPCSCQVAFEGTDVVLECLYGETVPEEDIPQPAPEEGFSFAGWNTREDGSGRMFTKDTPVKGDLTLYPCWSRPVEVIFEIVNGKWRESGGSTLARTLEEGEPLAGRLPRAVPDAGYLTTGTWDVDPGALTAQADQVFTFTCDPVKTVRVSFDWTQETREIPEGRNIGALPEPEREGWTFLGWFRSKTGGEKVEAGMVPTEDMQLYARWSGIFTLRYDAAGGQDAPEPETSLEAGESWTFTVSRQTPWKEGFEFRGWAETEDGAAKYHGGDGYTVSGDAVLYAVWEPAAREVLVRFLDGNTEILQLTLDVGQTPGSRMPPAPSRADAIFLGWNTKQDGTGGGFDSATVVSGDLTVYAQWQESPRGTVSFRDQGRETGSLETEIGAALGDRFPTDPERSGYIFTGWNTKTDGSGENFDKDTPVAGDLVVYAQWEKVTRATITFKDRGTVAKQITLDIGAELGDHIPADPVRPGWRFLGWNTREDGTGKEIKKSTTLREDMTVYAQWEQVVYVTVTFNDRDEKEIVEAKYGEPLGDKFPADPKREGYAFFGWNTKKDGSGSVFDKDTPVEENLVVYAQWEKITRATITFEDRGEEVKRITLDVGAEIGDHMPDDPARPGWRFLGWNTREDGTGKKLEKSTTVRENATFYAQWEQIIRVTVTFTDRDEKEVVEAKYGEPLGAAFLTEPKREGYAFFGWNTKKDGSGSDFDKDTPVEENLVVYAQWGKITRATIVFEDRGEKVKQITLDVGAEIGDHMPAEPARPGWRFLGWNTREDGTGKKLEKSTTVRENATFYAQWEQIIRVTVTFTDRDEKEIVEAKYGEPLGDKFPAEPKHEGYAFFGWNTKKDGSGSDFGKDTSVVENLVLYAQWEKITRATITFEDRGEQVKQITLDVGAEIGDHMPAEPTRPGWRFLGWNTREDGTGKKLEKSTTVRENTTFYAQWEQVVYVTVTFTDRDEKEVVEAKYGEPLGAAFLTEPKREGYAFFGWNTKKDGSGSDFDKDTSVVENLVVYAQWEKITRATIVFEDRGEKVKQITLDVGAEIGDHMPAEPARPGWRFLGWNTREDGTGKKLEKSTTVRENTTFYAQWEQVVYVTVTFTDRDEKEVVEAKYGEPLGAAFLTEPKREGYAFFGWNTKKDGSGSDFDKDTSVVENLVVYAQWEKITRATIVFEDRGEKVKQITLDVGAEIGDHMPAEPARPGWRFLGWNTREDGTGKKLEKSTTVRENATFYAQWEQIIRVTVTFTDRDEKEIVEAKYGEPLGDKFPADPKREGYAFTGWNTKKDGSGMTVDKDTPIGENLVLYEQKPMEARSLIAAPPAAPKDGGIPVPENLVLYAQWEKITRAAITFKDRGTVVKQITLDVGAEIGDHMPADPARAGWRFLGWNTREDGTGRKLQKSDTVREDTVFYAQWEEIVSVTVTFTDRDKKTKAEVKTGNALGAAFPAEPRRDGYTFAGWNIQEDGSGKAFDKDTVVMDDLTVYAQWEKITRVTVIFADRGEEVDRVTLDVGAQIGTHMPDGPERQGWRFLEWNTREDGTGKKLLKSTEIREDLTAYAQWEEIDTVTVTFVDRGREVEQITLELGQKLGDEMPGNPTRAGYSFKGWTMEKDGGKKLYKTTAIREDLTVYAQWSGKSGNPKTGDAVLLWIGALPLSCLALAGMTASRKKRK